jgi:hypothetical protein
MDEIGVAAGNIDWNAVLYQAANGAGKMRMTRNITARKNLQWTCNIISTGEKSILGNLKSSVVPEGLLFRVIDFQYQDEVFYDRIDEWSFCTDKKSKADKIEAALQMAHKNFGWIYEDFIRFVMSESERRNIHRLYSNALEQIREGLSKGERYSSAYERRGKTVALISATAVLLDNLLQAGGIVAERAADFAQQHLWGAGLRDPFMSDRQLIGEEVVSYILTIPKVDLEAGRLPGVFVREDGRVGITSAGVLTIAKGLQMEPGDVRKGLAEGFTNKSVWCLMQRLRFGRGFHRMHYLRILRCERG